MKAILAASNPSESAFQNCSTGSWADTRTTDGRPQIPRGASEKEAERCDEIFASRSLLGGTPTTNPMSGIWQLRQFDATACALIVLVEHLLRVHQS